MLGAYDNGIQFTRFGFKEYRQLAFAESLATSENRWERTRGRIAYLVIKCYDFVILGFIAGIFVVLSGLVSKQNPIHYLIWNLGLAVNLILILIVICIAAESTVNYTSMRSYGLAHHNARAFVSGDLSSRFVIEVATLLGIGIAALYVDAVGISILSSTGLGQFGSIGTSGLGGLFNTFYYAFLTLVFSTQLTPGSAAGKLLVIAATVHAVAIIIVAVTAFSSHYDEALPDSS
jgi:hypothetical protein